MMPKADADPLPRRPPPARAPMAAPVAAGDDAELIALLEQLSRDVEAVQAQILWLARLPPRSRPQPPALRRRW